MGALHRTILLGAVVLAGATVRPLAGAEEGSSRPPARPDIGDKLSQIILQLDSPSYDARQEAVHRMQQLIATPELAAPLAEQFHQLVVRPDVSYEVRWRITQWRGQLPTLIATPPQNVPAEEIDRLLRQLDDDSFSVRVGAGERLEWLASDMHTAGVVMNRLKDRVTRMDISDEAFRRQNAVWNVAWGTWLNSDAASAELPVASDDQIAHWLDGMLETKTPDERMAIRLHQRARQELLGAMARDSEVPRITAAIKARLSRTPNNKMADLNELLDLTRPAMASEIWRGRQPVRIQHLVIGEPQMGFGARRASYFDRIDENWAHCVSGHMLSPGDYPVGVAFPMPRMPRSPGDGFFFLVNLPTPRRQIAYKYYEKSDVRVRLADLSHRTLEAYLARKHLMNDAETAMLAQLDAREVSRFAGRYFMTVKDAAADDELDLEGDQPRSHVTGKPSLFGAVCEQLAMHGTREAAVELLEAVRQKRFLPPTPQGLYQLHWIAALSIAHRDPWPDADTWLAGVSPSRDSLIKDLANGPELGATAAAVLLNGHGEDAKAFGLLPAADTKLGLLGVDGYRYAAADGFRQIQDWWKRQSEKAKASELRHTAE